MKTRNWYWLLIPAVFLHCIHAYSQNSLRIAYTQFAYAPSKMNSYVVPPAFLDRVQKAGYNYVAVAFPMDTSDWNDSIGTVKGTSLRTKLTSAFIATDKHGLRLIPMYQIMHGSVTDWSWINTAIEKTWNVYTWTDKTEHWVYCPSFSPDPAGIRLMDSTIKQLIQTTKAAFDSARLPYPLEYIHIGHDELMATYDPPRMLNIATTSKADIAFIRTFSKDTSRSLDSSEVQEGIQTLIANEIDRRVAQIKEICGTGTKVLLWADMFDPQYNGKAHWHCSPQLLTDTSKTITTAGTLSKIKSKAQLIFMPWCYNTDMFDNAGFPEYSYNAKIAFQYFKDNNCRFVWTYSVTGANKLSKTEMGALREYISASQLSTFKGFALGYCAATWVPWDPGNKEFRVIEYIPKALQFPMHY